MNPIANMAILMRFVTLPAHRSLCCSVLILSQLTDTFYTYPVNYTTLLMSRTMLSTYIIIANLLATYIH